MNSEIMKLISYSVGLQPWLVTTHNRQQITDRRPYINRLSFHSYALICATLLKTSEPKQINLYPKGIIIYCILFRCIMWHFWQLILVMIFFYFLTLLLRRHYLKSYTKHLLNICWILVAFDTLKMCFLLGNIKIETAKVSRV